MKRLPANKPDAEKPEYMFTRRELGERWRHSIEWLKRAEKAGTLPAYKLGRDVRYLASDVLKIEEAARV